MKKNLTKIFIDKIKEGYINNKTEIENDFLKPIINNIFSNLSHYMYFIFIILLLIIMFLVINFIFLLYYSRIIIKKLET